MSLMRTGKITLWNNVAQVINATTPVVDVSTVEFVGTFYEVSAATAIVTEVETIRGWMELDRHTFTAAGNVFINRWSTPFERIRFRTTAACVATIEIWRKS